MEDKVREVARGMPAGGEEGGGRGGEGREGGGKGRRGEGEKGEWERDERGEQISRTYMHVNMTAILEFVRSKSIFS